MSDCLNVFILTSLVKIEGFRIEFFENAKLFCFFGMIAELRDPFLKSKSDIKITYIFREVWVIS
jgi:hypothetical protein